MDPSASADLSLRLTKLEGTACIDASAIPRSVNDLMSIWIQQFSRDACEDN